jgi:hypothetical protein
LPRIAGGVIAATRSMARFEEMPGPSRSFTGAQMRVPMRFSADAEGAAPASIATKSAGTAIGDSRQARCPARRLGAGIDAASMARQCQTPF